MVNSLLVALGGAIGTLARFWGSALVARYFGETFPLGTLLVNISGSFIIGMFNTLTAPDGRWLAAPELRGFVMIGICGGYTTFSSFSLQTLTLMQDGEWLYASLNVAGSIVGCLLAVWAGHIIAALLNSGRWA